MFDSDIFLLILLGKEIMVSMMINLRLVSQEHSQLPPENFRLSPGLRVCAVLILPWMSEIPLSILFLFPFLWFF